MNTPQVLIGSADRRFRHDVCAILAQQDDIDVAGTAIDAVMLSRMAAATQPGIIILDMQLLPGDPAPLIEGLYVACPHAKLLLFSDVPDDGWLVSAVQHGVRGCVDRTCGAEVWLRALHALLVGDVWIRRRVLFAALQGGSVVHGDPLAAKLFTLTPRERQIVVYVRDGLSNKQIARQLDICPTTVKTHLQHIFGKLDISRRLELLRQWGAEKPLEGTIHDARHMPAN
ncbi:response regulator transcription factor [Rudaea sp.]|uniref:response regulator transcription factor n=1 Tax=Rudaea sp. TaxID=2136325 RepID=UPI002ED63EE6